MQDVDAIIDEIMQEEKNPDSVIVADTLNQGGKVIPFPSDEARLAAQAEIEEKKAQQKARTMSLVPYLRVWMKRTFAKEMLSNYRQGNPCKITVPIPFIQTHVLSEAAIASFTKAIIEENRLKKIDVAPLPPATDAHAWEIMRAFMITVRRHNFGLMKAQAGYMIDAGSDHKVVQCVGTGENTYREPENLTFELWRVKNNDYEQPWKIEWISDPEDPTHKIQIKVYTKVQSVLKPWEKKPEPETEKEQERNLLLVNLKEGESLNVRWEGDHDSEAEEDMNSFLSFVDRTSQNQNIRYDVRIIDQFNATITHVGRLYR